MTALAIFAYILGALVLALWAAGEYIAVKIEVEERLSRFETGRADMYVSAEEE